MRRANGLSLKPLSLAISSSQKKKKIYWHRLYSHRDHAPSVHPDLTIGQAEDQGVCALGKVETGQNQPSAPQADQLLSFS